jgi:hypothetical protein
MRKWALLAATAQRRAEGDRLCHRRCPLCAITGGEYSVKGRSSAENEPGDCTFKNGKVCGCGIIFGKCDQ